MMALMTIPWQVEQLNSGNDGFDDDPLAALALRLNAFFPLHVLSLLLSELFFLMRQRYFVRSRAASSQDTVPSARF